MSDLPISGGGSNWGIPTTGTGTGKAEGATKATDGTKLSDEQKKALETAAEAVGKKIGDTVDVDGKKNKTPSMTELPPGLFGKLFDPKTVIEDIRNAKGADRDSKLVDFQNKLNNMSDKDLRATRDYLVKAMADPNNKDDETLGVLLNAVNKELDKRGRHELPHLPENPKLPPGPTFPNTPPIMPLDMH